VRRRLSQSDSEVPSCFQTGANPDPKEAVNLLSGGSSSDSGQQQGLQSNAIIVNTQDDRSPLL
jgi:hypothetical protein